jgi:hypothetical protein
MTYEELLELALALGVWLEEIVKTIEPPPVQTNEPAP